jgi:hypothetical protein
VTKTAYAHRMSAEEFAEAAKDLSPEDREELRIEDAINPLFDMWLRFKDVFGDRAIDRLDVSDEDAETAAKKMEGHGPAGEAFAYLLRCIADRRRSREILHKVTAVWAVSGTSEAMSMSEIFERYEKLPKGEA